MDHARHFSDNEESDDDFQDAISDVQLDAHEYEANRIKEQDDSGGPSTEDCKPAQQMHSGLGLSRQTENRSSDPFSFISQLDVRAYVAGSVPNRQGLGREKQELERKETEEDRKKDQEQNKHILYQGNLVEDWEPNKATDVLKFHKEGDAVENSKELIELEKGMKKVHFSSPPKKHTTPIKGSAFVLPPRPVSPQGFGRSTQPDNYIQQQQQQQEQERQQHQDKPERRKEGKDLTRLHRSGRPLWDVKYDKAISRRRKEDLRNCPEGPTWSIGAIEPMGLVDSEASGYFGLDDSLRSSRLFPTGDDSDEDRKQEKQNRERERRTPFVMQQFSREGILAAARHRIACTEPKAPKEGEGAPNNGHQQNEEKQDNSNGWADGEGGPKRKTAIVEWDPDFGYQHTNLVPKQQLAPLRPFSTYCKPPQKPDSRYYARPARFAPPSVLSSGKMVQKDGYTQFNAREEDYPFEEDGGVFAQRKTMMDYRDYGRKREPGSNHVFVPVIDYSHPKYSYMFGLGVMPGGNNGGIIHGKGKYRGGFGGGRSSRRV